ncbi:molybdopterin-dependent oxidoreductase [Terrabacter sp. NPDC000476]|uniref:molybdopterin-dependent oxidoreductase n=1 Tax=Terrabacter sp. NPDC000476 TaxID=3154258 RepID=UPI00332578D6
MSLRPSRTPSVARTALAALALVALSMLSACGSDSAAPVASPRTTMPYAVVQPASLVRGAAVPAPTGPTVLTVTGKVAGGKPVTFDMATLEKLGLVEYSVMDKQAEGRRVTFRGVLLSDVLATVGASSATSLHTVALNDYAVDIPVSDTRTYPVLLATTVDGKRMSVEKYGPVRVVYPTDGATLDPAVYDPRWIWQLTTVEVR